MLAECYVTEQEIDEYLREQERIEASVVAAPVNLKYGKDHSQADNANGVAYQRCGGGRRVIRKKLGGS